MRIPTFSEKMLGNVDELKTLFTAEREMEALQKLPDTAFQKASQGGLYYGRWQVAWIVVTAPFRILFGAYLGALSYLLSFSPCTGSLSHRVSLLGWHLNHSLLGLFTQLIYGKKFLAPTFQRHQISCSDVYSTPSLNRFEIPSEALRNSVKTPVTTISFQEEENCYGIATWFNFLFLKALHSPLARRASTVSDLATAVASLFADGAPRQSIVLQALQGSDNLLLDSSSKLIRGRQDEPFSMDLLRKLEDGVYYISYDTEEGPHGISYLQFKEERLIFDANEGLTRIDSDEDLIDRFKKTKRFALFSISLVPLEVDVDQTAG